MIVYLEILALSFIFTAVMLFSIRRDLGSEREVTIFKGMLYTLLLALIADGITHAQYRGFLHLPVPFIAFLYATYMFLMAGVMSFLWLNFAELRIGNSQLQKKSYVIFALLPILAVFIISYSSYWTGLAFSLDENGIYSRGPLWTVVNLLPYIYFFSTTIHALVRAKSEKSPFQRKRLFILSSFIISPALGALLQLFIGGHPFVAPSIVIAVFFIFINIQANAIQEDTLTGLNNRLSFDRHLDEMIQKVSPQSAFYVFMMDLNQFKRINDTYGHIEGDSALRQAGNVLRSVADEYKGFAARYGGDEFVAIIEEEYLSSPRDFVDAVCSSLKLCCAKANLPYALDASFGYTRCDSAAENPTALIADADEMLYRNKGILK